MTQSNRDPIRDPAGLLPLLAALDPLELGALAESFGGDERPWLQALCDAAATPGVGPGPICDAVQSQGCDLALKLYNARATAEAAQQRAWERGQTLQRLAGKVDPLASAAFSVHGRAEPTEAEIAEAVGTLTEVRRPLLDRLRERAATLRNRAAGRTGRIAEILRDRAAEAELAAVELEGSLEDLRRTECVNTKGDRRPMLGPEWSDQQILIDTVLGKAKPAAT